MEFPDQVGSLKNVETDSPLMSRTRIPHGPPDLEDVGDVIHSS
jgi:hypothetical protein